MTTQGVVFAFRVSLLEYKPQYYYTRHYLTNNARRLSSASPADSGATKKSTQSFKGASMIPEVSKSKN